MMERISVNTYVDAESDHKVENNGEDGDHGEDAEVEDDGEDIVVQMKIVERKKEKINVSRNRRSKKSGRRYQVSLPRSHMFEMILNSCKRWSGLPMLMML